MITKLDIKEKDGFLIMDDFPTNCIFNKVKTGCGATTIALTNNENYIQCRTMQRLYRSNRYL
jgi:uncharacterized Zn ribbon protein